MRNLIRHKHKFRPIGGESSSWCPITVQRNPETSLDPYETSVLCTGLPEESASVLRWYRCEKEYSSLDPERSAVGEIHRFERVTPEKILVMLCTTHNNGSPIENRVTSRKIGKQWSRWSSARRCARRCVRPMLAAPLLKLCEN